MPAPKGNSIEGLHVGAMLKRALHTKRVTHAVLGRRLGRNQSMIKDLVARSSLQTYLVWELSVALNHNFFSDLAQQLNTATNGSLSAAEGSELDQLKQEYQRLKEERDYLRKAVDLLNNK